MKSKTSFRRCGVAAAKYRVIQPLAVMFAFFTFGSACCGEVLLDDSFADGSRAEANLPTEAEVWIGREQDVTIAAGKLSTSLRDSSQKLWTYFTESEPVELAVGRKLVASVTFVPRGALAVTTARSFRIGVFHDPTDPRVEDDTNDDGGGAGGPWTDSQGYAVQMLVTGGEQTSSSPWDLGKRLSPSTPSLLGTSGAYIKNSGGTPVTLKLDVEYRVELEISKVSAEKVDVTARLFQDDKELSTFSVTDDGTLLGTAPIVDKFDQLYIRITDGATSADQIDFMNFKVEVTDAAH
jgi:hypothetical protein